MDIKLCSVADRNDTLYCLGIIGSCTGKSFVFDLQSLSREAVIAKLDHWRVQHLHSRQVKKLVMDNGSEIPHLSGHSVRTLGRLPSAPERASQVTVVPAHVTLHHANEMMQSPWLGIPYWFECMRHADDQLCRVPSRSHDNNCPQDLWDTFINGKITETAVPRRDDDNGARSAMSWNHRTPTSSRGAPKHTCPATLKLTQVEAHPGRSHGVLCANTGLYCHCHCHCFFRRAA